jgi:hypothetical protein
VTPRGGGRRSRSRGRWEPEGGADPASSPVARPPFLAEDGGERRRHPTREAGDDEVLRREAQADEAPFLSASLLPKSATTSRSTSGLEEEEVEPPRYWISQWLHTRCRISRGRCTAVKELVDRVSSSCADPTAAARSIGAAARPVHRSSRTAGKGGARGTPAGSCWGNADPWPPDPAAHQRGR